MVHCEGRASRRETEAGGRIFLKISPSVSQAPVEPWEPGGWLIAQPQHLEPGQTLPPSSFCILAELCLSFLFPSSFHWSWVPLEVVDRTPPQSQGGQALCFAPFLPGFLWKGWLRWCWEFSGRGSLHQSSPPPTVLLCSNVQGDSQTGICITIEPGLLLKGDILVRILSSAPGVGSRQGLCGSLASRPSDSPCPSLRVCPDGSSLFLSAAEVLPQEVSQPYP